MDEVRCKSCEIQNTTHADTMIREMIVKGKEHKIKMQ